MRVKALNLRASKFLRFRFFSSWKNSFNKISFKNHPFFGLSSFSRVSAVYYSTTAETEFPGLKRIVLDDNSASNVTFGNLSKTLVLHDPCVSIEGAEGMCVQINNGAAECSGKKANFEFFVSKTFHGPLESKHLFLRISA